MAAEWDPSLGLAGLRCCPLACLGGWCLLFFKQMLLTSQGESLPPWDLAEPWRTCLSPGACVAFPCAPHWPEGLHGDDRLLVFSWVLGV